MLEAITSLDAQTLLWIQEHLRVEFLNPLIKLFTTLGNAGIVWSVLTALLLCFRSTRRAGCVSALALVFSLLVTNIGLKPFIARTRPYYAIDGLIPLLTSRDPNSFPSGHTCAAFSAGIAWAGIFRKPWLRTVCVVQAVLMGLSRLYVGVHYPTDVLAGAILGTLCGLAAVGIFKLLDKKKAAR